MDSLPQEIIDEIIGNLPPDSLRSSSLVAKRWQKRSQQRAFFSVYFYSESTVNTWYKNTWHPNPPGDPGRIPSYTQFASFYNISEWKDPALFSQVLGNFSSLTGLSICTTEIPEEVPQHISHGRHRRGITALNLWGPRCSLSAAISMVLAFSNLQILSVHSLPTTQRKLLLSHPIPPRMRPLDSLMVANCTSMAVEALVDLHLTSRRLSLDLHTKNIQKLLVLSSTTVVELVLGGVCSLYVDRKSVNDGLTDSWIQSTSHPIDLPQFPALTSLEISSSGYTPHPQLINALSSICSAPVLASIALKCWWHYTCNPDTSNSWDCLDRWLSRMAKNATVEGGLLLTLIECPEDRSPEAFLPGFREAGKIKRDFSGLNTNC